MKNTFNIARFAKFFAMELRRSKSTLLIFLGLAFIGLAMDMQDPGGGRSDGFFALLIVIAPFILYNFVYHPTKSFTYTMLPASWLEKFMSAWVMCVIFVPALLFGFATLVALLGSLALPEVSYRHIFDPRIFVTSTYLNLIIAQAILAFWGTFWFRRQKVGKTILTFVGIVFAFIFFIFALQNFGVAPREVGFQMGVFTAKNLHLAYVIVVLPWIVSLIKFRRTQI